MVKLPVMRRANLSLNRVLQSLAERAAWEFVEENKVNFDLVSINPPWVSW